MPARLWGLCWRLRHGLTVRFSSWPRVPPPLPFYRWLSICIYICTVYCIPVCVFMWVLPYVKKFKHANTHTHIHVYSLYICVWLYVFPWLFPLKRFASNVVLLRPQAKLKAGARIRRPLGSRGLRGGGGRPRRQRDRKGALAGGRRGSERASRVFFLNCCS